MGEALLSTLPAGGDHCAASSARGGTGFATVAASWRRRRDNPRFSSFSSSRGRSGRRLVVTFSSNSEPQGKNDSLQLYGQIEKVFVDSAMKAQGTLGRWQEIQGAWILRPSKGDPVGVVHFVGGVFVGAAPQITYRLFLERLAERGFLIIATPFASGFDHLKIADETQFKFDRCIRALKEQSLESLPSFGVGHSLGALVHLLIGARYAVERAGNVLMSFNNKGAKQAIPLFSPVAVPMAQNLGPLLTQISNSPTVRFGAEMAKRQLETLSPPLVKQILPLVEQLPSLYMELANGKEDFTPTVEDATRLIRSYYGIRRNLLVRFKDDVIDETPELAKILSSSSAVSMSLDLSVRTLSGDHARPLQQVFPEVPGVMADAVTRGSDLLASLAAGTLFEGVAKEVGQTFGSDPASQRLRQQLLEDIENLVEEIAAWMLLSIQSRAE
ncbi:uncharacterized protein LOC9645252 [Selaginella moellendorffii]|uniref:uncharacterized protein LOC9645252 n=1 Tax=Selaginella moellendorffii TaxID=88036 RepID=UPI000D1CE2E2|nr:uncharacterized protein LOC9645252 [Selaginella moellendorffii]|eukprot:XP_024536427.1 uncharacterized protein LOC9645252 [Selaginella moellendorffii]